MKESSVSPSGVTITRSRAACVYTFRENPTSLLGRVNIFFIPISSLNLSNISKRSSPSTVVFNASFSLVSITSKYFFYIGLSTPQTSPWTCVLSSRFSSTSFHNSSTTLSHLLPARPFVAFSLRQHY